MAEFIAPTDSIIVKENDENVDNFTPPADAEPVKSTAIGPADSGPRTVEKSTVDAEDAAAAKTEKEVAKLDGDAKLISSGSDSESKSKPKSLYEKNKDREEKYKQDLAIKLENIPDKVTSWDDSYSTGDVELDKVIITSIEERPNQSEPRTKDTMIKYVLSSSYDSTSPIAEYLPLSDKDLSVVNEDLVENNSIKSILQQNESDVDSYKDAKIVGIIPRFSDEEVITRETKILDESDVKFSPTTTSTGAEIRKPVEEEITETKRDIITGTGSATRIAWQMPDGSIKYTNAPRGTILGEFTQLEDFTIESDKDKHPDWQKDVDLKVFIKSTEDELFDGQDDLYVGEDGSIDINRGKDSAMDNFSKNYYEDINFSNKLYAPRDKNNVKSSSAGFNNSRMADFGFYYDEDSNRIYKDIVIDDNFKPEITDENVYFDLDQEGVQEDLKAGNLSKWLKDNAGVAELTSASEEVSKINLQTQRNLERQNVKIHVIKGEINAIQPELEINTSFVDVFKRTGSDNDKTLNSQFEELNKNLTYEASEISKLYKMHKEGKDIDIKEYNNRYKKFEADKAKFNKMVEVLDLPMTEENGWSEKLIGGKRARNDKQRGYTVLKHKESGLEILYGYQNQAQKGSIFFDESRMGENALSPKDYIKKEKELQYDFAQKTIDNISEVEYLGNLIVDAGLNIDKRFSTVYKANVKKSLIEEGVALDNATIMDYSKRTLNQFTSNYFRAMSGFTTTLVSTIANTGSLVGFYDEKDMKVFARGFKDIQRGFDSAMQFVSVEENNTFSRAFAKTFYGKAHSAMIDMVFDVLVTKGMGKGGSVNKAAKMLKGAQKVNRIKKAKILFTNLMKSPASLANKGFEKVVSQTMDMMTNPMFLKIADGTQRQLNDPRFKDMSSGQKYLYTMGTSFVMGKLEQLGVDFATEKGGQQVVNHILQKAFQKGGGNIARNADNIIIDYLKRGVIGTTKTAAGFGFKMTGEGATEVTQDVFAFGAEELVNYLKGYNGTKEGKASTGFYNPDFFSKENLENLIETFALGAIATGPVAAISTATDIKENYGPQSISGVGDNQFSVFYDVFSEKANIDAYIDQMSMKMEEDVENEENQEKIDEIRKNYNDQINDAREISSKMQEVRNAGGNNLELKDQKKAYQLLDELERLEASMEVDGKKVNKDLNAAKLEQIQNIRTQLNDLSFKAEQNVKDSLERGKKVSGDATLTLINPDQDIETQLVEQGVDPKSKQGLKVIKNKGGATIIQDENGNDKIFVAADSDVEALINHEERHNFWKEALNRDPESAGRVVKIIKDFLKNSPGNEEALKDINRIYDAYLNDSDYTKNMLDEEFIMLFGDKLNDKNVEARIKDDRGFKDKLKGAALELYRNAFNIKFKEPENIDDVFDLLRNQRKALEKGKKSKRLTNFTDKGFKGQSNNDTQAKDKALESKKDTPLQAINKLIPSEINTKQEFENFTNDRRLFPDLYKSTFSIEEGRDMGMDMTQDGVISNYVKSRSVGDEYLGAIESVRNRITNFDPTAKRADGSTVGTEGFGEFIFANTNFGKMDSKKKLAQENEKRKREESTDTEAAKQLTTQDSTPVVESKKDKVTPRSKIKKAAPEFVTKELEADIEKAITGIIKGSSPDVKSKEFRPFIKGVIEGDLTNKIKKELGIGKDYDFLIKKLGPKLKDIMPIDYFVKLESQTKPADRLFTNPPRRLTKQTDIDKAMDNDKIYVEKAAQGANIYTFKDFNPKKLVDYILAPSINPKTGKKSGLKGTRKTSTAASIAFELGKDMIPSVMKKLGIDTSQAAEISKKIQREPRALFRKETSLTGQQVTELIEAAQFPNKQALARELGFSADAINEKSRKGLQDQMLEAAELGFLDLTVIEAGKMGSGGKATYYGNIVDGKFVKDIASSKKYIKRTNGEYVLFEQKKEGKFKRVNLEQVNENTDYIARQGRLYYGKKDPAYQTLIRAAGKSPFKKGFNRIGLPKGGKINAAWAKSKKAQSDLNMNILDYVVNQLSDAVNVGKDGVKMSMDVAGMIIIQSYQGTSGLIKAAAPFKYISKNFEYGNKKDGDKKYREEHNPPASVVGASIMVAIKNNTAKEVMKDIRNNFYQTVLSKKADSMLDMAKLDAILPNGTYIGDNPIIRLAKAGINLNDIINVETGQSMADEFGLGVATTVNTFPGVISLQNDLISEVVIGSKDLKAAKKQLDVYTKFPNNGQPSLAKTQNDATKSSNTTLKESKVLSVDEDLNIYELLSKAAGVDQALKLANSLDQPTKKIRVFDFDDTLATSKNKVYATKGDQRIEMNAEKFATDAAQMIEDGWTMDFSDFDNVTDGKKGPLFEIAKTIKEARGNEDLFVLTARGPNAETAIYDFLKAEGLEFKRENIVGLGKSPGEAKANWIIDKAAEGYNDFYFADDAYQNVKAVQDVLSVIDVKSKVQLAKVKESKKLSLEFNDIIEKTSGVDTFKEYSAAKAQTIGANKGRFKFFIPYSAEDFLGLVYPTLSKGSVGDAQMAWYKRNLIDPYTKAQENLSTARLNLMNDFKQLKKSLNVPKSLRKKNSSGFTNEQAVRVHLFTSMGYEVPGLSKRDLKELNDTVENDSQLLEFSNQILTITKGDGYAKPDSNWLVGTITTDLINLINTEKRSKYLANWQERVDAIYSKENLSKLEATYGTKYVDALTNMLTRMKTGKNRLTSGSKIENQILDYINGSIGTIMFFNTRSAVLQTISSINFVNWSFNNPYKAGKAFANQKQYWTDFKELMNSDFLVDRRNGLKLNISESEIADAASTSDNKAKAALNWLLSKGFLPTQYADSFAIASGGATFFRNRISDLVSKGMSEADAKKQAMIEFRQIAEESQQSSDPSRISQQQSSNVGRLILAFANTPMQYARIQKRAIQDLVNGRGDAKSHVSRIVYYGFVQNVIFNALQQAVFALGFGDDDDEKEEAKSKKYLNVANGMLDSLLRGLGIGGAAVSVAKNFLMDIYERSGRDRPEYVDSVWEVTRFSPPIYSKLSKLKQAGWQFDSKKRRELIYEKGFSLDNPAYEAAAKVVSATTNVPLDRVMYKIKNIEGALDEDNEIWQRVAMMGGWPKWQLEDPKTPAMLTPEEKTEKKANVKIENYKKAKGSKDYDTIKKLTSDQQIKMLKSLGFGDYTIKNAKSEQAKIDLIIAKNSGKKIKIDKEAIRKDKFKKLSKAEQVRKLDSLGLSKADINALKYEDDRVKKMLELMK